jgi:hypothetical protein
MARGSGNQRGRSSQPTSSRQALTKPAKYSEYLPAAKVFALAEIDNLPERDLHGVEVYSKDFRKLTNLLNANEEGSFHIFGVVYPQDDPYEDCKFQNLTFAEH